MVELEVKPAHLSNFEVLGKSGESNRFYKQIILEITSNFYGLI